MKKMRTIRCEKAAIQAGRCYYCNHPTWIRDAGVFATQYGLTIHQSHFFRQTAEHLLPRGNGGNDTAKNIVMACFFCNSRRHRARKPLPATQYKAMVLKRVKRGKWHGRGPVCLP